MTVAHDLQNMVADLSAAIAGRATYGRSDLEILRRKVEAAARDAGELERTNFTGHAVAAALCDAIDAQVVDLTTLAKRHRAQIGQVA